MTTFLLFVLACTSPAPLEAALERPLTEVERQGTSTAHTFVLIDREELVVGSLRPAEVEPTWPRDHLYRVRLVGGLLPDAHTHGQLVAPLYDDLLARAEQLAGEGEQGFDGRLTVLIDRQTDNTTLQEVLYSARQAGFETFDTLLVGD